MPADEVGLDHSETMLEHRAVVSNFIFKGKDSEEPLVALFRRSKGRTYSGKLCTISGSIESDDGSPLDAALRELQEETGLTTKDLTLHLKGKPFTFTDQAVGRRWTVHSFSWILRDAKAESEITIDWEHSGWQWASPRTLSDSHRAYEFVPNLGESFRRVWLGDGGLFGHKEHGVDSPGDVLEQYLLSLKNDHDNDARCIATSVLQYLYDVLSVTTPETCSLDLWSQVQIVAWHLINNSRASMHAAVGNSMLLCLSKLSCHRDDRQRMLRDLRAIIRE